MAGSTDTRTERLPRITRTFLFSDLRGYTNFVETHGDEAAAGLLADYRELVRLELAEHGGVEMNTEGDSFFLVFESSSAALDCAVAIQRRLASRNVDLPLAPIEAGMGAHVGETVAQEHGFVGSAVNLASRIGSQAGPGEVLISDTLRGLLRTGSTHPLVDRGPLRLKGIAEPIRVWRVEWASPGSPSTPSARTARRPPDRLVCPVLVGRHEEVALLDERLDAAILGRGDVVIVKGEAGVGKTTLVRSVIDAAALRGVSLAIGSAHETDRGVPYGPFLDAVRSLFPDTSALRAGLDRFSPESSPLFSELVTAAPAAGLIGSQDAPRYAGGLVRLLTEMARTDPFLVFLEDIHWADETSLAVLELLARELGSRRMLVVATARSDELTRRHPLRQTLVRLRRDRMAVEIELEPLTRDGVRELLRATLAQEDPGVSISDELLDAVEGHAEGNPFFTEEILKSLVSSGDVALEANGWQRHPEVAGLRIPATIRDAIEVRLERLDDRSQAALAVAAAVGRTVPLGLLSAVIREPEETIERYLHGWIEEQLVEEAESRDGPVLSFRHALTHEVVYDQLLTSQRRRTHRRIAEALQEDPGTPRAILGRHWALGGEQSRAAATFDEAADAALAVAASFEAIGHVEAAIQARGATTTDDQIRLARAYLAFDNRLALDAAQTGLESVPADDLVGRVRLMHLAGAARWLAGGETAELDLAREALAIVGDTRVDALAAETYEWLATACMHADEYEGALHWAERAMALAGPLGLEAILAHAMVTAGASRSLDDPPRALKVFAEAEQIAIRIGAIDVISRIHYNCIAASFYGGSASDRRRRIDRAIAFAERYAYQTLGLSALRAYHDFVVGAWPAGGDFGVAGSVETDQSLGWVRLPEAVIHAARSGPDDELLESVRWVVEVERSGATAGKTIPWLPYFGLLASWAGRFDDLRHLVVLLRSIAQRTPRPGLTLSSHAGGFSLSRSLLLIDRDRASLVSMAEALADVSGYDGEADMTRAFVRTLEGDRLAAARQVEQALVAYEWRGLRIQGAVEVHALSSVVPFEPAWETAYEFARSVLEDAQASWLREQLTGWRNAG